MRIYLLGFLTALLTAASVHNFYRPHHHLRGTLLINTAFPDQDPAHQMNSFYQEVVRASAMPKLGKNIESQLIALQNSPDTEKSLRDLAEGVVKKTKKALETPSTLQKTFQDESLLVEVAVASLYDEKAQKIFPFLQKLLSTEQPISPDPIFGSPDTSTLKINRLARSALDLWLKTKGKQQKSLKELCVKKGCNTPHKMAQILNTVIDSLKPKTPSKTHPIKKYITRLFTGRKNT